LGLPI